MKFIKFLKISIKILPTKMFHLLKNMLEKCYYFWYFRSFILTFILMFLTHILKAVIFNNSRNTKTEKIIYETSCSLYLKTFSFHICDIQHNYFIINKYYKIVSNQKKKEIKENSNINKCLC